jgi:hypothetical protein
MSLQTYWLVTPLVLTGLSGFGWLALWLTWHREKQDHPPDRQDAQHLTARPGA